jgi:hypothetical protein
VTQADDEALIEHCHVVTSRARLTAAGRLVPAPGGDSIPEVVPAPVERPLSAHG